MKTINFLIGLFLFAFSSITFAGLPPQYLSVPYWQACASTMQKNGADFVCLPKRQPQNCPRSSWKVLNRNNMLERCM